MFTKVEENNLQREVKDDVSLLADTLDELLSASEKTTKEQLDVLRSKAKDVLKETRSRASGTSRISQYARETAVQTKDYVVDKPWQSLGITAALGIVLGVLLSRR
ncbi:DUF883 family protein [Acerihabitans sp. TG2]|uniref:DUF883 family protein n=1 Tax=Acerihabitans sp. TG2 TaxID=3096008 RepID=UPI002B22721E|nr:DUF883 family protein [Acerihabitans sp. TG2]MEA9391417.1 DUF883 family protein [Acerihabitans sp. TG2]